MPFGTFRLQNLFCDLYPRLFLRFVRTKINNKFEIEYIIFHLDLIILTYGNCLNISYYFKVKSVRSQPAFTIVLFKSLRNSKRRNKGKFTSKSNSNKIKLCGGQHYLV